MKEPDLHGLLGCRWIKGGRDPKTGIDCLGLVILVEKRLGRKVADVSYDYECKNKIPKRETLAAVFSDCVIKCVVNSGLVETQSPVSGDIVLIAEDGKNFTHCGVLLGDGRMVHCDARGSRVSPLPHCIISGYSCNNGHFGRGRRGCVMERDKRFGKV